MILIKSNSIMGTETIEVTLENCNVNGWIGLYRENQVIEDNKSIWHDSVKELGDKNGNGIFQLDLKGKVGYGEKYKIVLFKDTDNTIDSEVEFEVLEPTSIKLSKCSISVDESLYINIVNSMKPAWIGLYEKDADLENEEPIWKGNLADLGIEDGNGEFTFHKENIKESNSGRYRLGNSYKFILAYNGSIKVEAMECFDFTLPGKLKHIELKTSVGLELELPKTITRSYDNGNVDEVEVQWNNVDNSKYRITGAFTVYGQVLGMVEKAKANITVLENHEPLFSFEVISDIHIPDNIEGFSSENFDRALKEINSVNKVSNLQSVGLMINGDITDGGKSEQWETYKKILENNNIDLSKMYEGFGNHDTWGVTFEESVKLYCEYTRKDSTYFHREINGYHFIFLGTERQNGNYAWLSETQLKWFEKTLVENSETNKPIFVFLHQGIMDTAAGTKAYQEWHGITQENEVKEVVKQYPQIMMFSGHSHWELQSVDTVYNGKYATFVNTGSVSYLWNDNGEYIHRSEGWFIDVYEDKIVLKGRDFTNQRWVAEAQYIVNYPDDIR